MIREAIPGTEYYNLYRYSIYFDEYENTKLEHSGFNYSTHVHECYNILNFPALYKHTDILVQ